MLKNKKLLCKISTVATSMLLGLSVTVTAIMVENKTAVNNFFNTTEYEVFTPEDDTTDKEYFTSKYSSVKDLRTAGKAAAQRVEEEGAVLLKNDNNALPLKTSASDKKKISLFSISSVDPAYGGRGSAQSGSASDQVTPVQGFEQAGFEVNADLHNFYKSNQSKYARSGRGVNALINDAPWTDITAAVSESKIAEYGDAAVFILTRVGGEGADAAYTGTDGEGGNYLKLSANEKSVLQGLAQMKQSGRVKRIILLLNVANQVECKSFLSDGLGVDAVLWIGSVGITGFNAVADIIAGKVNPSGHLADTFWYEHGENPAYYNFGDNTYENYSSFAYLPTFSGGVHAKYGKYVVYQEGLYVGYRYTETRYYDSVINGGDAGFNYGAAVSYPFGYGLSYTTFTHSAFGVTDNADGTYTASVTVTNTGAVAGKDVVQIYVQKPYGELSKERKIQTPVLELVGYAKTDELAPYGQAGSSQTVEITVNKSDFTSYDAEVDKTYILAGGNYRIVEGADVHDAVNNLIAYEGHAGDGTGDENKVANFEIAYDNKTYSVSNGKTVTNLFDDGNVNKYFENSENSVEYLSRDNWAESFPAGGVKLKMTEKLAGALMAQDNPSELVKKDDIEYPEYGKIDGEKIRLIDLLVDENGNKRDESYYAYDAKIWDKFLDQLTWDETIELLNTGLRSTAPLVSVLKPGTVEHNGPLGVTSAYNVNPNGLATRKSDPDSNQIPPYYPCVGVLASTFNEELATLFGDMMGEDAIWAGYGGLYGIGLNIHRSPYGGRLYEYYSEDPFLTGHMAAAEVKALQAHGCNAYIKHFALNDQETNRSGLGVWLDEQTLREIYLKPFYIAVNEGGAMNAMAAFNRLGATHCPASKALLTDFLKGEAGMKGFVVTDMYSIGYSSQQMPIFMAAGCDLPDGEIQKLNPYQVYKYGYGGLAQNMRDSAKRIMYATVKSNSMNGISVNSQVNSVMPAWRVVLTVVDCLFGVLFAASAAWAVVLILKDKVIIKAKRVDSNKNNNDIQGE